MRTTSLAPLNQHIQVERSLRLQFNRTIYQINDLLQTYSSSGSIPHQSDRIFKEIHVNLIEVDGDLKR